MSDFYFLKKQRDAFLWCDAEIVVSSTNLYTLRTYLCDRVSVQSYMMWKVNKSINPGRKSNKMFN